MRIPHANRHDCDLPQDEGIEGEQYMVKWKHHFLVSMSHPSCKVYFRSRTAYLAERSRHVTTRRYQYIVHPFSRFTKFREIALFFLWLIQLISDPLHSTFMMARYELQNITYSYWDVVKMTFNLIIGVDILVSFFIGYAVESTGEVVLEPRKIAIRYLKTHAVFDFIALMGSVIPCLTHSMGWSTVALIHQLCLIRLTRVGSMSSCFMFFLKVLRVRESVAQCLNVFIVTVVVLHWWTCYFSLMPVLAKIFGWDMKNSWATKMDTDSDMPTFLRIHDRYMVTLLKIMCHFYGAGVGTYQTIAAPEMLLLCLVIISGMAYYCYSIVIVGTLFGTANISASKYDEVILQLKEYAANKYYPNELRRRLYLYYEYKFQHKFFSEQAILSSLSEHLRLEVILHSSRHLIENVHIFRCMSRPAIGTVLSILRPEIYLPGDRILGTDIRSDSWHFISHGTVAVYFQDDNTELYHLEDGDHFSGDVPNGMILGHKYYVKAIEITKVYSMSDTQMTFCKTAFPEIGQKVGKIRQARMALVERLVFLKEDKCRRDILYDLGHGKILQRGEPRRKSRWNFTRRK